MFYNTFILIYGFIISIASIFNAKAAAFIKGRKGLFKELSRTFKEVDAPVAWFHVASLGEFEQARLVIEAFKETYPCHFIYLTFFSPSGYEQRKNYQGVDYISYLPLDTPGNARKLVSFVKPSIVVFVKYDFWYHYLNQVHRRGIPLYCISALFTPKHIFFKSYGGLHRRIPGYFTHLFVQNEASKSLLSSIGIHSVSVSGDTRFDRVVRTLQSPEQYPVIEYFKGDACLMVIGSSWPTDLDLLHAVINQQPEQIKFVIAPHEVDEASLQKLEAGLSGHRLRIKGCSAEEAKKANILIINTMGMLSNIYQYGDFAYIGGAFGDGLHNILEAVAFGLPVIFGNKGLDKFPESLELTEKGGAFPVNTAEELQSIFAKLVTNKGFRAKASAACKAYIKANTGTTALIMAHWKEHYEG